MTRYDFAAIQEKWKARWESDRAWSAPRLPAGEKRYVLEMFPYPSGDMHMGHVENFTIGDVIARYWTKRGYDVLHPFGFDAFGLPAENAAIKRGTPPREWTYANIERFTASCKTLAFAYDWDRSFATCDPSYYRWNQWLFLKLFERGLAYRAEAKVNWCPSCRTVLANEQLSEGVCWRCGSTPQVRDLEQWFFRTTAYAQRLLDDMDQLSWTDAVLTMQRNWIGRSDGAVVNFTIAQTGDTVPIFTTRPDTLYGATFFVFAPEHPIAHTLAMRAGKIANYEAFVEEVRRQSDIDRMAMTSQRRAFDLEATAVNPLNGEEIPVFASDYVLMGYGTGAIMAVPAHDQRDFEFARQYGIPIRVVVQPEDAEVLDPDTMEEAYEGQGHLVNSGPFDGNPSYEAKRLIGLHLKNHTLGYPDTQYRLRDWLVSRQRYWGTPFPIVHCPSCGVVPVPEEQLPVELPEVVDYQPTGDAVSPLATATDWVKVDCPTCGGEARRETDTMDTFVDSSWYFLRFCDARNDAAPFDPETVNAWMPVEQYTGGTDHAVMHLIYARFITKFLNDIGLVDATEPFMRLLNQGWITKGGKAMSKSLGNVVEPAEVIEPYGADTLRLHMMFIGPPEAPYDWPEEGAQACIGSFRFLERVWRLVVENAAELSGAGEPSGSSELRKLIHRKLAVITDDYDRYSFNTAVARLMELQAALTKAVGTAPAAEVREGVDVLLHGLAPFCPYVTEELWERLGGTGSIHKAAWPEVDRDLARVERVTMVVQVDSKVRDRIEVDAGIGEQDAVALALASENVRRHLPGEPAKVIARPPRLVNLLTG
ncbi:MAG TPA: leucine--tRNA ligase [Actinomycetota bacterium]|nr:leucine--tRNA ligase [Actinomycetota bacterium]